MAENVPSAPRGSGHSQGIPFEDSTHGYLLEGSWQAQEPESHVWLCLAPPTKPKKIVLDTGLGTSQFPSRFSVCGQLGPSKIAFITSV